MDYEDHLELENSRTNSQIAELYYSGNVQSMYSYENQFQNLLHYANLHHKGNHRNSQGNHHCQNQAIL